MDDVLQQVRGKSIAASVFREENSLSTWSYRTTYTSWVDRPRKRVMRPAPLEEIEEFAARVRLKTMYSCCATSSTARRGPVAEALRARLVLRDGHTYAEAARAHPGQTSRAPSPAGSLMNGSSS